MVVVLDLWDRMRHLVDSHHNILLDPGDSLVEYRTMEADSLLLFQNHSMGLVGTSEGLGDPEGEGIVGHSLCYEDNPWNHSLDECRCVALFLVPVALFLCLAQRNQSPLVSRGPFSNSFLCQSCAHIPRFSMQNLCCQKSLARDLSV